MAHLRLSLSNPLVYERTGHQSSHRQVLTEDIAGLTGWPFLNISHHLPWTDTRFVFLA